MLSFSLRAMTQQQGMRNDELSVTMRLHRVTVLILIFSPFINPLFNPQRQILIIQLGDGFE